MGLENLNVSEISNLPIFWVLASVTVLISAIQAILYVIQANKATKVCKLDPKLPRQAFKIGLISAIGPACGVFIVMVGLMTSIGGPIAWQRLSIIGAAGTELAAATCGAQAYGLKNLADPGYNIYALAVSWFAMALNGAGWLVFTGVATPGLEKLRDKMSGGDIGWLAAMSAACSIGIFGYLNASQMVVFNKTSLSNDFLPGPAVAILTGAAAMMLIGKVIVPKHPKLAEYSLGIAMVIGIACAIIYDLTLGA